MNNIAIGTIIFFSVWLFISFFLIGYSVKILPPLHVGLLYNGNTIYLEKDKLWTSGRYFVGLGYDFLLFPTEQRSMIFSDMVLRRNSTGQFREDSQINPSIRVRSQEGLDLEFEFYVSYKLTTSKSNNTEKINQLTLIYENFGDDWDEFLDMLVLSEVRDVASQFTAFDWFDKVDIIGDRMFMGLKQVFFDYHFELLVFNLLNMNFPVEFQEAILATEIVIQNQYTWGYYRDTVQVQADTRILEAQIQQSILTSQAMAQANSTLEIKYGISNASNIIANNEADALLYLKNELGLVDEPGNSAASKILSFLWIYNLKHMNSSKISMGLQIPKNLNLI